MAAPPTPNDPLTGPQPSVQVSEVEPATFRLTLEAATSRQREAVLLFQSDIVDPKLNEPIRLDGQGSTPSRDMVPVIARLRLMSGSAADFKDAILSIRIRRRRRAFHEEG